MNDETDCVDFEENAILDRFGYPNFGVDDEPCSVCITDEDCADCKATVAWLADEEKADSDDTLF